MSCGKPHDVPCSEVLARVYSYLDDEIENTGVLAARHGAVLSHAVADDFAAAKSDFVTVDGKVLFDFDNQSRIREPDTVAGRRPVKVGISAAVNEQAHVFDPMSPLILP